jgi:hypothetical protein
MALISLNPHTHGILCLSRISLTWIIRAHNDCQSHNNLNMKPLWLKGNDNPSNYTIVIQLTSMHE